MKTVSLSGSPRANVGKTDAAALRAKGLVPCVVYGNGKQLHFYADERHFKDILYTPDTKLVHLNMGSDTYKTIVQESQFHRISDRLMHVDFLIVEDQKPVTLMLPVKTIGQSEGVKAGGKLNVKMRKLKVRGLISKMPDAIELNVETLQIGKSISAGDIKIDGLQILHPSNISVVSVQVTRAAAAEEAATTTAAAATAPAATPAAAPAKK